MDSQGLDRREFFKQAASLACASSASSLWAALRSPALPNPVGYATIAWPESRFVQGLETISGLGFKGVQMLGWVRDAYAGSRAEELKERLTALRLQPVALSCSSITHDPAVEKDESDELRAYAAFFARLGGHYLQVTDGGEPGREYSSNEMKSLATRMNAMGKIAQDQGLTLGYHPHFGTLGESRQGLGRVLDATDARYVKLIADVAHLALGGADPAEVIRAYAGRLIFTHFKDVRKEVAEVARKSRELVRSKEHSFCEIGDGTVDFPAMLQAFRDTDFRGWIVIELDGSDVFSAGPESSARRNKEAAQKLGLSL